MRSLTAIELGAESCVLVRVQPARGAMRVSAVHGLLAADDPPPDVAFSDHLRAVRRGAGFPTRARVVAWGLHEAPSMADPGTRAALDPLLQAGFSIEGVLTPPMALARLAAQSPPVTGREGVAWMSLNRQGAAIAIVHEGELLFSREFGWTYRLGRTIREELLQRYLLVAHLAPELRQGMKLVRARHGTRVDAVVTCGDLPDLRSLTMPLTEELDIEVETLDSLDGLEIAPPARTADIAGHAPALRLACAAASTSPASKALRPELVSRRMLAAAAVVAALAVGGALTFALRDRQSVDADAARSAQTAAPPRADTRQAVTPVGKPLPATPGGPEDSARPADSATRPQQVVAPVPPPFGAEAARDGGTPAATSGSGAPALEPGAPARSASGPTTERPSIDARVTAPARPPGAAPRPPRQRAGEGTARTPLPLNEPVPMVNSILAAPDRRLAVVDGVIVREGDAVGRRFLVRIEPDAVVLREPSGHEVRVPIRRRRGALPGSS